MKFGFGVTTESLPRCIPPRELMSNLGSTVISLPTTLLKLGLGTLFSFEFFGSADPLRTRGPYLIHNILCPSPHLVVVGSFENWAWGIQPGGGYGIVEFPWSGAIPNRPDYLLHSREDARTTVCRVRDDLLWESRLACAQSLSDSWDILRDHLVNRTDRAWDYLWTKRFLNNFCGNFPLVV